MRSSVVLPAPLGPSAATISPGATVRETSRIADDRAVGDRQPVDGEQGRAGVGGLGRPVPSSFVGHAQIAGT